MIVDCRTCPVRDQRCDGCAVTGLRSSRLADPTWEPLPTSPGRFHGRRSPAGLALDAAESRAVSIFVGAGLVDAGAAAGLRARRETEQDWRTVRQVG